MPIYNTPLPRPTLQPTATGSDPRSTGAGKSGTSTADTHRPPDLHSSAPDVVANVLRRDTGQKLDGVSALDLRRHVELLPWVDRLFAGGITTSVHWQTADTAGRVGAVGEALRLMQIADEGLSPAHQVFQGMVVVELPEGLGPCRTSVEAVQWCFKHGAEHGRLTRFLAEDGTPRFGLMVTEVDVVIFEKTAAGLEMRRVENVKAGYDASQCARHQNRQVADRFVAPTTRFLFPVDGNLVDHNPRLVRTNAVREGLRTQTVGPSDGKSYDLRLPLTREAIVELVGLLVERAGTGAPA